jgi:phosphoglucomutase
MISQEIVQRIQSFCDGADAETLRETADLLATALASPDGAAQVEDAFYRDLDFGTGGLRGVMGPGTNRMNRVTVAKATQGMANYIRAHGPGNSSVCIAYDSRNRSPEFARVAAAVLAGNGIRAYLFTDVRPTPELSFAVRHFGATAGIVITASHNPKEYNGYKVSWSDGAQVIAPQDRGIIEEVRKVATARDVTSAPYEEAVSTGAITLVGAEVDDAFIAAFDAVHLRPDLTREHGRDLKIVYTPLHGTGIRVVPKALERWGFTNLSVVPEQARPDGNFPTTRSPNPEERAALELGIALARSEQADIVFATDPDADRIGVAVRHDGDWQLLTGNQVGALLAWYVCETLREQGRLPQNGVLIKTIVTTELIASIAADYGVALENCLTGFKYIGALIRAYEEQGAPGSPTHAYLMGCEESYGYLVGTHARDKDAIVTACVLAEIALWAKGRGRTLVDLLHDLFIRHGVHVESQLSKAMPGQSGMEMIASLMESLRMDPPSEIAGIAVASVVDIERNTRRDLPAGVESPGPGLPRSNVILFHLADGSVVVARPSGTEPKVKFYFLVADREGIPLADPAELPARIAACQDKDRRLRESFDALVSARTK